MVQGLQRDGCRLGCLEEAGSAHRLQPYGRVRIVGLHLEQAQRIGNPIAPVAQDTCCRSPGPGLVRTQHAREQLLVHPVVPLLDPERLHHLMLVSLVLWIQPPDPCLQRGEHFLCVAGAQLDFRAVPDAIFRLLQQIQELRNRRPRDDRRLQQRTSRSGHAEDPAMLPVTRRITQVVLHVPDHRIVPVDEVEGAVRTDLGVDRAEVLVGRLQNRLYFF